MRELIQKQDNRATIRWKLLTGVSALALTAYVSSGSIARAEDAAQPQLWIELGGQLSRLGDGQETFAPALMAARPSIFSPSQPFERPPLFSIDEFGKISFQPENSDWLFSASIHYGRSASKRDIHQQTYPKSFVTHVFYYRYNYTFSFPANAARFADTNARTSETHAVLDFQAGKDVGLGMFGIADGSSTVSLGVRIAQFSSKSNIALKSDPDWQRLYKYVTNSIFIPTRFKWADGQPYHSNAASFSATRSFRGIGPSLSWNASAPFAGSEKDGELTFDWGLNAALLFGRQRTKTHHQTTGFYGNASGYYPFRNRQVTFQGPAASDHTRSRNITVPNVGGFAGLTYRVEDFKVSFGYRADMFFGVMDGGIDARKDENRAFYGPYASISIGLGD